MRGLYGTLISSPAAAHLRVPARLSGRVFEAAASVRPTRLQQAAFSKIAKIAARRAFDHIDGEFKQTDFPGIIDTLYYGAERFVCAFHAVLGAVDHRIN